MSSDDVRDALQFWNSVAADWRIQVGAEGDKNRRLNSDPVLWSMTGGVAGLTVLDAGCGPGYLTAKLAQRGASPIGVDFSPSMIELARRDYPELDFRVDSVSRLETVPDATIDLIVSNYVLMDTPELEETVSSFHRVLKPGGIAVLVFSHPCFPAGASTSPDDPTHVRYEWDHSYFERRRRVDPPWRHFTQEFIWFHRPLSDYWKAFTSAGFSVTDFEEPRLTEERFHLAGSDRERIKGSSRPYSVAFRLMKSG